MGVTIYCKKTHRSIDMGAGVFLLLRRKISELAGEPLSTHYAALLDVPSHLTGELRQAFYKEFDEKTAKMIEEKKADIKIIDFLLQSDVAGRIRYGACKKLLKIIGDYDDNVLYGYCGRPDCAKFADFKAILQDCAETKSDLVWD